MVKVGLVLARFPLGVCNWRTLRGVPIRHIYGKERAANTWTGKLLFATNNRLHYTDRSHALTVRLDMVDWPHTLPQHDRDPFLMHKLAPEICAFAKACIDAALHVLATGRYPVSQAMRELLHDIEMNGDSAKLWLTEQCMLEQEASAMTQALYENYRTWCEDNGVRPLSRPKLRDAMLSYSRQIISTKRRVIDTETGESKPMWCLLGIRLRLLGDE
jgi:phage/plasmid-associated DNA primase